MISDYYTTSVIIKRNTTSESTMGSIVNSWAVHLTILGCLRPLSYTRSGEVVMHNKIAVDADYVLYCAVTDIVEKDKAVIDDEDYDVKYVRNVMSRGHHLEILLRKIE